MHDSIDNHSARRWHRAPRHKMFVGKAPLRETMAAGFLWQVDSTERKRSVDPCCGSGTIRSRPPRLRGAAVRSRSSPFAHLWAARKRAGSAPRAPGRIWRKMKGRSSGFRPRWTGHKRARDAMRSGRGWPRSAGSSGRPGERPGAARGGGAGAGGRNRLTNPPYGARIRGARSCCFAVYGALGRVLAERFRGNGR